MEPTIDDIEHARELEATIHSVGANEDIFALRSALIHFYAKKNYLEDLIRLSADPNLLSPDDFQHILSALIDSNRIQDAREFVARLDDAVTGRWDIRLQLARIEVNASRFDLSLAISKNLLLEKKDNPGASGLFILSLIRLNRYSDLFEYVESASGEALSANWAVLAFAHEFQRSSSVDAPRMLRAIEKISLSRGKEYRLWSVRLKRIAGFINEALEELKANGSSDFLEVDYDNELSQTLSSIEQYRTKDQAEIVKILPPLEKMVLEWVKKEVPPESMTVEQIEELITASNLEAHNCIILSVGHDNYKKTTGGLQLCIQMEEHLATQKGWCYLNVHPWQPLPILATERNNSDLMVSLILNGKFLGSCYSSTLTRSLKKITIERGSSVYTVVHSLMGHSLYHVKAWIKLNRKEKCWIWLHDFFTLCPSYALQRNNVSFCNAPVISSNACRICNYGDERVSHLERMRDLFTNVSATIISPSEITKSLWLAKVDNLKFDVKVLPHMEFNWFKRQTNQRTLLERPISIGYLGGKVYHKGWPLFEKLVNTFGHDSRFKFYYFGNQKAFIQGVHNVHIDVSASEPYSMINAVSETEIDFVLHWPTWPETFSFTTHEAIAGGAHVLTNAISGNVAAVVNQTGRGTILSDADELLSFFREGKVEQTIKTIRTINETSGCKPTFSAMTIPLLIKEHSL